MNNFSLGIGFFRNCLMWELIDPSPHPWTFIFIHNFLFLLSHRIWLKNRGMADGKYIIEHEQIICSKWIQLYIWTGGVLFILLLFVCLFCRTFAWKVHRTSGWDWSCVTKDLGVQQKFLPAGGFYFHVGFIYKVHRKKKDHIH